MNVARAIAVLALGLSGSLFANTITYTAVLNGAGDGTTSPGTGSATVVYDSTANTLFVDVSFSGLEAGTTASHIHCCTTLPGTGTAGVATQTPTFINFPLGVTSGTYTNTFDLGLASSYNPAFVSANGGTVSSAEAVFLAGLASDKTYLNIHTTMFPGGEINGFLVQQSTVPEPGGLGLVGMMVGGAVQLWRRRLAGRT
jgi:hypothetical protein